MNTSSHQLGWFVVLAYAFLGFSQSSPAQESASVRSQAVLDFGFEESKGSPQSGEVTAELKGNPLRVDSPFWGQAGRRAIVLDAGAKQIVQIPDGPQVDRPQAVSLSLFFLNLHPVGDGNFHGLVAKRAEANAKAITNYGINYRPNNDALQLYLNDGGGFKSVVYSVKQVLNTSRLLHLTATWEVGDAPAPDADTDKDDVRVRLFLNGKPVTPKSAANGQVSGADGWLLDIKVPQLLNDVPVTIGSSTPTTEFTSGVIDEFLLFDTALNDDQAAKLFHEVAGANADELVKQELQPLAAVVPEPKINTTSLHGLQAGQTTRLAITGTNLGPNPRVVLSGVPLDQKVLSGSNAGRLDVQLKLPKNSPLGWFPLFVETKHGISQPFPMAVDGLPQHGVTNTSPEQPAQLPAAFSGQMAGGNMIKIYFRGKVGDRVSAEVEAKRLGSAFDPVVEIKTERGTPLKIGWSETALRGDARAEVRLPKDGVYYAELHDLAYKAPGQNRFRLKLGDFRSIDQWFPAKILAQDRISLKPVGAGFDSDSPLMITGSKMTPGEALHPKFVAGWPAVGPL
ncbi:MAG: hypothetical protein KDA84_13545, partial [Planctomycetaceae bacterium]|nr:hypothetical protein [Planctomycetaceae bacterium]